MAKLLTALLALAVPGAAMPSEEAPEVLPFTGKWEVGYDRDSCSVTARFGEGDKAVVAAFTRFQPGDSFTLTLTGKRLRNPQPSLDATLDFGIKADTRRDVLFGTMGATPAISLQSIRLDGWQWTQARPEPPEVTRAMEKSATGLTVSIKGGKPFRLVLTKGFGNPMVALRACMDDLIKSWGYDPAVHASLSRRVMPRTLPGTWLTNNDYQMLANRHGANGVAQFRLDVDPAGKIAGCHILAQSVPDEFADLTCQLMTRRAQLKPALDADGKPVRSFFVNAMRFQLPP